MVDTTSEVTERERFEFEKSIAFKELKIQEKQIELESKKAASTWHSPLNITLIAAVIGLFGNATVSWFNSKSNLSLETHKAESARILQSLKVDSPDQAAENLKFLVSVGLVDERLENRISDYLKARGEGEGVALGSTTVAGIPSVSSQAGVPPTSSKNCDRNLVFGDPSTGQSQVSLLCRNFVSLGFSDKHRLPLWVMYKLEGRAQDKGNFSRGAFSPDPEVRDDLQASATTYQGSGYDRGHLVPLSDFSGNSMGMQEASLYTAIAPQHPTVNRGVWRKVEALTSEAVRKGIVDELWIYAGPIFNEHSVTNWRGGVTLPSSFYRIVFDGRSRVVAWVVPNIFNDTDNQIDMLRENPDEYLVSIDEIENLTELNFLNMLVAHEESEIEAVKWSSKWLME